MKKTVLKSSLLAGVAALLFSFSTFKNGSLTDITKPYTGVYECKSATLGDKEYLDEFSYIRLELNADNTFSLYYCPKNGKAKEQTGKYRYNKEKGTIQFSLGTNGELKREIPLKKGEISFTLPLGAKTLIMRFAQN